MQRWLMALFKRITDQLRSVFEVQFVENVAEVRLNRAGADKQMFPNLLIGIALNHLPKYPFFSGR